MALRRISLLVLALCCMAGCAAPHSDFVGHYVEDGFHTPQAEATLVPETSPIATVLPEPGGMHAYADLGCVYAETTALYAEPQQDSEQLQLLPQGQTLRLAEAENGFYPAKCRELVGFVAEADVQNLGRQLEGSNGMINVRLRDESILCYMLFAQEENFCNTPLYDADVCMLEINTFAKLQTAQQRFMQDGYRIKLNDAYRPQNVQYKLFDVIPDRTYIANPATGSRHNRGLAVDMTLVDMETGLEIEMPSEMHVFGGPGRRDYEGHSDEARKNMEYMTEVMEECGFTSIRSEWWHFMDLSFEENYPVLDIRMSLFVLEN